MKNVGFTTYLVGTLGVWGIPFLLLIDDPSLGRFLVVYIFISFFFAFLASIIFTTQELPIKSLPVRVSGLLCLTIPLFIFITYPFSLINFLLVTSFIFISFFLPFWSRDLTWWFYTLGGLFPLPKDHNWLAGKPNQRNQGKKYLSFIKNTPNLVLVISLPILILMRYIPRSEVLLMIKMCFLLGLFGIILAAGVTVKKDSLMESKKN